jgi:hypothetical protein
VVAAVSAGAVAQVYVLICVHMPHMLADANSLLQPRSLHVYSHLNMGPCTASTAAVVAGMTLSREDTQTCTGCSVAALYLLAPWLSVTCCVVAAGTGTPVNTSEHLTTV